MPAKFYVPIDVNFDDDEKVIEAGILAEAVYQRMLRLAKRNSTDGYVAAAQARRLCADIEPHIKDACGDPIAALLNVGLITATEGGYTIAGWLRWNMSNTEMRVKRQKEAEKKQRSRDRKRETEAVQGDTSTSPQGTHADATTCPPGTLGPATDSEVKRSEVKSSEVTPRTRHDYDEDFADFWSVYPLKKDKGQAAKKYAARRNDGITPERLLAAAKHYADSRLGENPKFTKHAATFLAQDGPWTEWEDAPAEDGGWFCGTRIVGADAPWMYQ